MQFFSSVNFWFTLARASHFAACVLLLSAFVFDRLVAMSFGDLGSAGVLMLWSRIFRALVTWMLPVALLTGGWWVAMTCISMTGLAPREALTEENIKIIWNQTHFGAVWKWRVVFWIATSLFAALLGLRGSVFRSGVTSAWLGLASAAALSATLAWSGHAMLEEAGAWHLTADVFHILVCGIWPAMLVPFMWLLSHLHRLEDRARWACLARVTSRFSSISLIAVGLLTASGLVNTWFLLGPISNLVTTVYGRVLLVKVAAFVCMIALGAVNLVYLRPRICVDMTGANSVASERAARQLRLNVILEILLAAVAVCAVGYLGLAPPPIHPGL